MHQQNEFILGMYELSKLDFYTEGPAVDASGNVFATTLSGGEIVMIDWRGRMSTWAESECPNGQIILPDGEHLICDSKLACIRKFDSEGNFVQDVVKGYCAGEKVNIPNDLVINPSGGIYFTDSVRHTGKVFSVSHDGTQDILADNLDYPNGLAVSACGKWLYVAESYQNRILKLGISEAGLCLKNISVFIELPRKPFGRNTDNLPDGLTIDVSGNLWIAHYGMGCVHQYSPLGQLLTTIYTGMPLTSNIAFADSRTAIVTGGYGEPGPGKIIQFTI